MYDAGQGRQSFEFRIDSYTSYIKVQKRLAIYISKY